MDMNPVIFHAGRDILEILGGAIAVLLAPKLSAAITPMRPGFRLATLCWPMFDQEIANGKLSEKPFAQLAEQVVRQAAEGTFSEDQVQAEIGFLVKQFSAIAHDKKGRFGEPEFVLPRAPGRFDLSVKLDEDLLDHLLR